jgi:hypothetical protein
MLESHICHFGGLFCMDVEAYYYYIRMERGHPLVFMEFIELVDISYGFGALFHRSTFLALILRMMSTLEDFALHILLCH